MTIQELKKSENFFLLAGPCVIEGEDMAMRIAERVVKMTDKLDIPYVFKGSYRKANRSRLDSFTGIGDEKALKILKKVHDTFNVPVVTDIHGPEEAEMAAEYVDVFCDKGFFTVEQTERIIREGAKYGLRAKIHANELAISGGVEVGVANGALSVDHLESMGDEQVEALRGSKTMPTMLPGCAFFLGIGYPPARKMIDAGLAVALASDFNPGTAPSGNMRFVVSLASIKMKMTPAEALNAATLNSAAAMGESKDYGSITRGKVANFYITKPLPSLAYLPYAHQTPVIREVVLRGKHIKTL